MILNVSVNQNGLIGLGVTFHTLSSGKLLLLGMIDDEVRGLVLIKVTQRCQAKEILFPTISFSHVYPQGMSIK